MPDHIHPLNWVTHPLRRKAYTLYMPDRMPDLLQDGSHAELAGSKACLACSWALKGGTDVRTDGKSPHSTGQWQKKKIPKGSFLGDVEKMFALCRS